MSLWGWRHELLVGVALAALLIGLFTACGRRPLSPHGLDLAAGEGLHVRVEQRGADVNVRLVDPRGEEILMVDSPNAFLGPEEFWAVAERGGRYDVVIENAGGEEEVFLERLAADGRVERLAEASRLMEDEKIASFEKALALWRELGETRQEAIARYQLGQSIDDLPRRIEHFTESLRLARQVGEPTLEIEAGHNLGGYLRQVGHFDEAAAVLEPTLELAREVRYRRGEAAAINNLGLVRYSEGRLEAAIQAADEAAAISQELGNEYALTIALDNAGSSRMLLGRLDEAAEDLGEAWELAHRGSNIVLKAQVLLNLGWLHRRRGQLGQALETFDAARAFIPAPAESRERFAASILDRRGTVLRLLGRIEEARREYELSLAVSRRIEAILDEAHTLANLGELALQTGELGRARALSLEALELFQRHEAWHGEIGALYRLAQVERMEGQLRVAEATTADALDRIESLRLLSAEDGSRLLYLETRQHFYELHIDVLMDLAVAEPGQGFEARAFEAAERTRARVLLDLFRQAGLGDDDGNERLRGELGALVSVERLRRELLDDDTLLLAYHLGDERSFLWLLGGDAVTTRILPPRREIEGAAERLYRFLASHRGDARSRDREIADYLAEHLLAPIADRLDRRRVVIVADGALHLLPFGLLPLPASGEAPARLGERFEVVHLPSASVLASLRNAPRRDVSGELAMLYDPIFTRDDPRLPPSPAPLPPALPTVEEPALERLAGTEREAAAILALVGSKRSFSAGGSDATLEAVKSGAVGGYRILHLATHGRFDEEHPERTGIYLSRYAADGNPLPDHLLDLETLDEIDLGAELVVLSACRTARGQTVPGEGVVGLARGFFQAGARQLVVSLWDVDDDATAELMRHFYHRLLEDGLPPAAALTAAQAALRAEPRFADPRHWAAFVFQGDWQSSLTPLFE